MKLSNMSVKGQLTAAFATLTLFLAIIAGMGLWSMSRGHSTFQNFVQQDTKRIDLVNQIIDATNGRAIEARNLVLATDDNERAQVQNAVNTHHQNLQQALKSLKAEITSPDSDASDEEKKLFASVEAAEARYSPIALGIVSMAVKGEKDASIGRMNTECRPALANSLQAISAYIHYMDGQLKASEASNSTEYQTARAVMLGLGLVALLLSIGMSTLIVRSLMRALGAEPAQLGAAAQNVAAGDLQPIAAAANAPEGSVMESLSKMQGSLSGIVAQVRDAATAIAAGSGQIANGNMDLSKRTEEQAGNLQQTAASMEEISATIKHNADTAQQANQLAASASDAAKEGGEVMQQVVSTMEGIAAASRKITDIIGVIDGIAFQTNILALNAAVEAARAGEQGRGFAVVAGEVRSLAQRSADAAKEIKELIGASVSQVESGTHLVDQAGQKMGDIVGQVRRVTDLIGEISSATREQTAGAATVSEAMHALDQTTQQNTALVEESAAASEALKGQASRLSELVGTFRIDTRVSAAALAAAPATKSKAAAAKHEVPAESHSAAASPAAGAAQQVIAKAQSSATAAPQTAPAAAKAAAPAAGGAKPATPAKAKAPPAAKASAPAAKPAAPPPAPAGNNDDWETF